MLVNVYLDGEMGKEFGNKWELDVSTPQEALQLIQANTGRLYNWMRLNVQKYANYKVLCVFKNGDVEYLNNDTYFMAHNIKEVRFTPVIQGSGAKAQIVVGAVLVVGGIFFGEPMAVKAGIGLVLNGVSGLMARKQKANSVNNVNSHYFQGVDSTEHQGNPVPLIYGRCKVVGIPISVKLTVGQERI